MKKSFSILLKYQWLGLLLLVPFLLLAQSKEELEKKREKLLEDIQFTKNLLEDTKQSKKSSLNQLLTLRKQIEQRANLISTLENEIALLDDQIAERQGVIQSLEEDLESLKKEYARMIRATYKAHSSYNRLLFIFSAQDFNDLFMRIRYLKRYTEYRRKQAELIKKTQADLRTKITDLKSKKKQKSALLNNLTNQKQTLKQEEQAKNQLVSSLKQKERKLISEIERKKQTAADLKKAIEDIIKKEMEAAKKEGNLSLTPEAAKLSADFTKNKGKLPWPVTKGIITGTFGTHPHPVLKQVEIKNNGIDIKTGKDASVRAVFKGKVKNVMYNPSFHRAVMIQHGNYFTVYSNLKKVFVKPGQEIATKQVIGKVYTDDEDSKAEVHLEIWKGTETLNPQSWLYIVQ